ncbi:MULTISPECIES: hypothetical protein [Nocardiaceae]|uniref:Anti-sigma-M factor RsmA n=1 Tax=Rhodococcoides kroppenstedtii TaxID=293050 RepID=A0ABS7NY17_9NOCA|nr:MULTISPECIES: hypothetical protein [Rhodococcus]AMY21123.1 Anti-sigma-M factor RsmA [Rhodococcus sp. PBTS 1]MBY6313984.1 hypothetical protein [Rhodococcus kroppenstedtii]MBY6321757.1 hypothetical protein [Rhodococcus kroppenstedtii]MBY6400765.1 hypothetical protein [Rhodococcus kroppenstedtii]
MTSDGERLGEPAEHSAPGRDELADLHAGALSDADVAHLRPRLLASRESREYLQSLDEVQRLLRERGGDLAATAPIPPGVEARVHAALAAAPIPSFPRRHAIGAAAAAVALVIGVGALLTWWPRSGPAPTTVAAPESVTRADVATLIGRRDDGPLADPSALAACLAANEVAADTRVLGSGPISLDGRDATLLVLPGGAPGALVALAVGPRCGPGFPDTVARADIG